MNDDVTARFLRYIAVDTASDETTGTSPSTVKQFDLAHILIDELKEMGVPEGDITFDPEHCYVYCRLRASTGADDTAPKIGFIAHMDTSPEAPGKCVSPRLIENYDGGDIVLGNGKVLSPDFFPDLKLYAGPDESYDVLGGIPANTRLIETGAMNGNSTWLFTEYNGQCGWINTLDKDGKMVIYFEEAPKKPVIYLYPEQETDVHVELELTESELNTTYPKYDNGWDVTAYPDGMLLNKADGSHHKYLFWDAVNCRTRFDFSKGFCVAGSDTESFLKEKLTYMGLNEQEMNEFIVYWLPLMEHNAYNLISFQGDAYTNSAKLKITPTPDSECRVFMAYVPLENAVAIEPQQLETFGRNGFTVVEWGGAEVNTFNVK